MIQVNRIYLIFNRLVTKKFLVDTSDNIKWRILHYSAPTGMNKPEPNLMGYTMEKDSFNSFFGVAKIVILSNLTK